MFVRLFSFAFIMLFSSLDIFSMRAVPKKFSINIFEVEKNSFGSGYFLQTNNSFDVQLDSDFFRSYCMLNNGNPVEFLKCSIKQFFKNKNEDVEIKIFGVSGIIPNQHDSGTSHVEHKSDREPILSDRDDEVIKKILEYSCLNSNNYDNSTVNVFYLKVKTKHSNTPNSKKCKCC